MTFSEVDLDEFCRECGITVTWTSEIWVHDYPPADEHEPKVPTNPDEDEW